MNMLKRMASIAIIAVMVLQVAVVAAPVPNDVIGTEYESAASMLCALDIMVGDGSNFNPDNNITRAEFAQIMMKSLALDSAAEAYQPVGMFTDVSKDNIFAPAIELGAGIGAIRGYGDGLFGPDDNVKGTEAVKMMVYAAGHDAVADGNGGYPTGYMSVAMDIGMLTGISHIDFTVPMTRGQAAILCANTLKVDMKKKITAGGEVQYVQKDGVNLLSEKHDTYMAEGIVSSNELTELYTPSSLREGRVQISGDGTGIYLAGSTTIADALGQYVKAYYTYDKDAGEGTIVSYDVVANKNIIQKTSLSNIASGYTNAFVEYWKDIDNDIKPEKVEITTTTPAIILNGVATNDTLLNTLNSVALFEGDITFIDSKSANGALGSDGKADVIIITAYDTIVVNKITSDETGQFITSKISGGPYEFDLNAPGVVSEVTDMEGNEMFLEDVWSGDILSVAQSVPGTRSYVKIVVSTDSVEGVITEKSTKNGYDIVSIDGEKYKVSKKFNTSSRYRNELKVGREAVFYTDVFGNVVYGALTGETEGIFGLMTQYVDGKGLDTALKIRIYTEGEYADFSTAAKVIVDGVICREPLAVKNALNTALSNITSSITTSGATQGYYDETTTVTPLLYTLNEEGLITDIDTPYYNTTYETRYTLQPVKGASMEFITANYSASSLTIEPKYTVTKTTPVISLPAAFSELESVKKIAWVTPANFAETDNKVQMFSTDPSSTKAQYIVSIAGVSLDDWDNTSIVSAQSSAYFNTNFFVVSDVIETIDEEGKKTVMLTGLVAGAEKEYTVDADYFADGAAGFKADIWRPEINAYNAEVASKKNPNRASAGVIVGDVIRFKANGDKIVWVEPIYLSDVQIVRSRDYANRPDVISSQRKSAIDVFVAYKHDEELTQVKSLITKNSSSNTNFGATPTTLITTNANGFIVSAKSKDSAYAQDIAGWDLYDEANNRYLINNGSTITNGFAEEQILDLNKFPIMVFDASKPEGKQVFVGSINNIYDTVDPRGNAASLIITQRRDNNPKCAYVVKF